MKREILFAIIIAVTQPAALFALAAAQENKTPNGRITTDALPGEHKAADNRITVRLKNAPLTTLLDIISYKTGLNFSFGDSELAKTRVTIFFRDTSPDAILECLTKAKDLEFQRLGKSDNFVVLRSTTPFEGFPPLTRQDIEDPVLNRVIPAIRLKGSSLSVFLDIVSAQTKVNFVVTGDVPYIPISVYLRKITVVDLLQLLRTKGLSYSRVTATDTFVVRTLGKAAAKANEFAEAEKAFGDKKYEEAIAHYKESVDSYPDSEMADYALLQTAICYDWLAARDNDPSALKEEENLLNRLITDYPKSTRLGDAYLYLGQIYSGYGGARTDAIDCKKAIELYDLAIKNTYRDWVKAQAGARIAQCYERDGNKEKAAALYREIVEKYPETHTAKELGGPLKIRDPLLASGTALEEQTEYKLAIEVYKRLVEKGSPAESVRNAQLRIGICQAAMNETENAIKTFDAYVAQYKPGAEDAAYLRMGQALEKAGRADAARKYLEQSRIVIKRKKP